MSSKGDDLYKILNLKKDCTNQDIKNAFIKLSKKHHPDMNKEKGSHEAFLKVNDAYSVLSKPETRKMYDQQVDDNIRAYRPYGNYGNVYTTKPYGAGDPSFYANSPYKGQGSNEPYYSIKGLKKMSNSVILTVCFAIAALGISIEYFALRKSIEFDREKLRHESARNHLMWEYARQQAVANGNQEQIKKFMDNKLRGGNVNEVNALYVGKLKIDSEKQEGNEGKK